MQFILEVYLNGAYTMKIYVLIFLALLTICANIGYSAFIDSAGKYPESYSHPDILDGIWKSKTQWKFQWVKQWHVKKVFIPEWKKVWTPVEISEWIPLPNTPHK